MDIALLFTPGTLEADIAMDGPDLLTDRDLETAVTLSLFTDRRANSDDLVEGTNRRGWWADTYADVQGDKIGSRLWLLEREKQTQSVLNRARTYCQEALQWLIDDRVAEAVNIEVEFVRMGFLGIRVEVLKPTGAKQFKYEYAWSQL